MFCSIKFGVIKPPPWNCQQNHFGGLKKAAKNWRQNMLRWWSSWTTDCFLLMSFLHDSCDGEAPWHCTPTKPFWFMIPRPRPWRIRISDLSPAFIAYPDLDFRFHSESWCIRRPKVHQVWPKAVSRPKRVSYHWAASKFGRGTTRGNSTGRSAVWSDVTQHRDSVREIDIESWAQSFVNILVYTFFSVWWIERWRQRLIYFHVVGKWICLQLSIMVDIGANVVEIWWHLMVVQYVCQFDL